MFKALSKTNCAATMFQSLEDKTKLTPEDFDHFADITLTGIGASLFTAAGLEKNSLLFFAGLFMTLWGIGNTMYPLGKRCHSNNDSESSDSQTYGTI